MCRTQPLRVGLDCCGTKTVCIPSIKVCFYCLGVAASERGDFKTARDYFELKLKELKVTGNKDLDLDFTLHTDELVFIMVPGARIAHLVSQKI